MAELLARLKSVYAEKIDRCASHPFTTDLCNGELTDNRLYVYLYMDLKFFLTSLRMILKTASQCDQRDALVRLGKQVGTLCGGENDYFDRALSELRCSLSSKIKDKGEPQLLPEVGEYVQFLEKAISSFTYAENITAIYLFEYLYLLWAEKAPADYRNRLVYKHSEWIALHEGAEFSEWVNFLESEVVRQLNPETVEAIERVFARTLDLEIKFFDSCYNCEW